MAQRHFDTNAAQVLEAAGIHPVLARVFAARGAETEYALNTDLANLHHHLLLKGSEEAAARLAQAVLKNETVVIVADYDADGATACAVGVRGLRLFGMQNVHFFVPDRFVHGYGLTPRIVEEIEHLRPDVLLTVDNGIASVAGVAAARGRGIDVVVTDHHLAGDQLPDAIIVNPNQPGCKFPSKALAGVGVMFYVLLALRAELAVRHGEHYGKVSLAPLLDLVALGTVADVVPLDHNNRILVEHGLRRIRAGKAVPGILALCRVANRDPSQLVASDLGFSVGPRLNAAGRLTDMRIGINCLLSDDPVEARGLAATLHELNADRKEIETRMQAEALAIPAVGAVANLYSLVLHQADWHAGVIGLVASRIKEKYYRPVICFAKGDTGELKGSGRSIPGLHLRDALDLVDKKHPGLILKFGGHAAAAGLSIQEAHLAEFSSAFEAAARSMLTPADLTPASIDDGALQPDQLCDEWLAQAIHRQVWGQGFPPPVFVGKFRVLEQSVLKDSHLRLKLGTEEGQALPGILFNRAEQLPDTVWVRYELGWNVFRGAGSVQLRILEVLR